MIFKYLILSIAMGFPVWALEDKLVEDIKLYRKDHVERFKDMVAFSHGNYENYKKPYIEALKLLCGHYGIRKTPSKDKNRYHQQVTWAVDFIQRHSFEADWGDFLQSLHDEMSSSKVNLDGLKLQHISFSVLISLVSQFYNTHTFEKDSNFNDLYAFVQRKDSYQALGEFSERFHTYISQRFNSEKKLKDYINATPFDNVWEANHKAYTIKKYECHYADGFKTGLNKDFRHEVDTRFMDGLQFTGEAEQTGPFLSLKGTIKGVPGDGTCSYHAYRAALEPCNWEEKDCIKKSRQFTADRIIKNIDNPLIRYWAAMYTKSHLEFPKHTETLYKGINDQYEWKNLKKQLAKEKDEVKQWDLENSIMQFYYKKDTIRACVDTIIKGSDWALTSKPYMQFIFSYLDLLSIVDVDVGECSEIVRVFKLIPLPKKTLWLVGTSNHTLYMEDPNCEEIPKKEG